jgi:hypothetical protein
MFHRSYCICLETFEHFFCSCHTEFVEFPAKSLLIILPHLRRSKFIHLHVKVKYFFDSMTLTQTERGYPPVVEHVGKPVTVRREMGKELELTVN